MLEEKDGRPNERVSAGSHEDREPKEKKIEIVVIYNGVKKPMKVLLSESISAVLQRAIAEFGSPPNPHTLSLFTDEGKELPDGETVKQVGIRPGEKLLLRPSAVKGG